MALTALTIFAATTVLSTMGFGIGMVATPFLLLVLEPQTIVVVLNSVAFPVFAFLVYQNRAYLPLKEMAPFVIAAMIGAPLGVVTLKIADPNTLRISITVLILILTILIACNIEGPTVLHRTVSPIVGFIVGSLIIALGIGGPFLVLLLLSRRWPSRKLRAGLALFNLSLGGVGLVGYYIADLFNTERMILVLIVAIPAVLGLRLGSWMVNFMNEMMFRQSVIGMILVTSTIVLIRELFFI